MTPGRPSHDASGLGFPFRPGGGIPSGRGGFVSPAVASTTSVRQTQFAPRVDQRPHGDDEGLDVRPPHTKPIPFVVEGYQVPDQNLKPTDLLPKGVEIRTPVRDSIEDCLAAFKRLHERLQQALQAEGYRAAALSFHPTEDHFEGPQNKRRYDHWQWAMEAMTTYGPDVNVSLPAARSAALDLHELHGRVNYYAPALVALSLASPLYRNALWQIRGAVG